MNNNNASIRKSIREDPDYVFLKRFDYSLARTLERYPEGCPDRVIAHALMIAEDEIEEIYEQAVARLKILMGA